jgi:hypothetical protein
LQEAAEALSLETRDVTFIHLYRQQPKPPPKERGKEGNSTFVNIVKRRGERLSDGAVNVKQDVFTEKEG